MTHLTSHKWLVPLRTQKAPRMRIICAPHAGGWPSTFNSWRELLPDGVELLVTQFPGRGSRLYEPPYVSVEAVVDSLIVGLEPWLNVPYVLFGHSFGSLVCFELARQLRRAGYPQPTKLVVSARQAPQIPSEAPFVHRMSQTELMTYLKRLGGIPKSVAQRDDLLFFILRTVRADFQALERYLYYPDFPLDLPITACGALDDPIVPQDGFSLWAEHTMREFRLHWMLGGHFYPYGEDNAKNLIEELLSPTATQLSQRERSPVLYTY